MQGPLIDSKNYDEILSNYFRLDVSLEELCKKWAVADQHFEKSQNEMNGVRILDQEVVENLFSFICSSNNNIQRFDKESNSSCASIN